MRSGRSGFAAASRVFWLVAGVASGLLLGSPPESGVGGVREFDVGGQSIIQRFQLLNGLRILFLQSPGGDRLVVNLLIRSGSTRDPIGKPGLAHSLARRLLVQTPDDTKELQVLGIDLQVDIGPDATILRASMPPRRLHTFLGLLGAALSSPLFEGEIGQDPTVVRENTPGNRSDGLAHSLFRRAIFGDHPYGSGLRPSKSVEDFRYRDLDDFKRRHYIPNHASLIVVGGISAEELLNAAREMLGPWTKGIPQESNYPEFPWLDRLSIQLVGGKEDSSEAGIVFGHRTHPRSGGNFYSLEVLNLLLGGLGTGSRLSRVFLARQINYRFLDSRIRFFNIGGMLQVFAKVPKRAAPGALMAILETIESLKQSPVSESELLSAKTQLIARHGEKMRSPNAIADELTQMELFSLSKDFLQRFGANVRRLTPQDIQRTAKSYLSTTRAVAVVTGADPEILSQWRGFGTAEVIVFPQDSE